VRGQYGRRANGAPLGRNAPIAMIAAREVCGQARAAARALATATVLKRVLTFQLLEHLLNAAESHVQLTLVDH